MSACDSKPLFLFDFEKETDLDMLNWKCKTLFSLSNKHVTAGKKSLKLELYPSSWPGLTVDNFGPDWSKYRALMFDVYNTENTSLNFTFRIDDKINPSFNDRVNDTMIIDPGENHLTIILSHLITTKTKRNLNLTNIKKIVLFLANPKKKRVVYLDNLRLE